MVLPLSAIFTWVAFKFNDLILSSASVYKVPVGVPLLDPVATQTSNSLNKGSLEEISVAVAEVNAESAANPLAAVCLNSEFGNWVALPKSSEPFVIVFASFETLTRKPSPGVIHPTLVASPVFPRSKLTPDFPICCVFIPASTSLEVKTLKAAPYKLDTLEVV